MNIVDHDALEAGRVGEATSRVAAESTVYRGWMLDVTAYRSFEAACAQRGATFITTSDQYRAAHELPGWYQALAAWTPDAAVTNGFDRSDFEAACARLGVGAAVLRDHVQCCPRRPASGAQRGPAGSGRRGTLT